MIPGATDRRMDVANILLLEDDESLNRGITLKLQKEGYQVTQATVSRDIREMKLMKMAWISPGGCASGATYISFFLRRLIRK